MKKYSSKRAHQNFPKKKNLGGQAKKGKTAYRTPSRFFNKQTKP